MFKRIDHVEIVPSNLEKSIDFYVNILNFQIKSRHQRIGAPPIKEIVYLRLGDSVIEFLSVENPSAKPPQPWQIGYRMIALEVEDMKKAEAYLKEKGVEITWGPVDLGNSIRAEIKDPDGLPIELRQW